MFRLAPYILAAPIAVYFWFVFRRVLTLFGMDRSRRPACIIAALPALALYIWARNIRSIGLVVVLYLAVFCGLCDLVDFIIRKLHRTARAGTSGSAPGDEHPDAPTVWKGFLGPRIWNIIWRSSLIPVLLTAATIIFGWLNMHNIVRTNYELPIDVLAPGPSSAAASDTKEFRIAFISDLHLGINMDGDGFAGQLERIETEGADVLLLGGDMFDENTTRADMERACLALKEFPADYGIYFVYGNHDPGSYRSTRDFDSAYMERCLTDAGVTILKDEAAALYPGIILIGREDNYGSRKSIEELVAGVPTDDYIIVLDHQPLELDAKSAAGADLNLAGHTHGGQIWPLGLFNATVFPNDMNYGIKQIGDMYAITSSGIAGWGYPIRTEGCCEYVMITLTACSTR